VKNKEEFRDIEDILEDCLNRLIAGAGIDDCLKEYPLYASRLEPLLETGVLLRQKTSALLPPSGLKARVCSCSPRPLPVREERAGWIRFPGWQHRWATAAVSIAVIFLAGAGMIVAAGDTLPGDLLYPVKLAGEKGSLLMALSEEDRAGTQIQFAGRRVEEAVEMAQQGRVAESFAVLEQASLLLDGVYPAAKTEQSDKQAPQEVGPLMTASGEEVVTGAGGDVYREEETAPGDYEGKLVELLQQSRKRSLSLLSGVLKGASPATEAALERLIGELDSDYAEAIDRVRER